ncbi:MAG: PAS domain S-box protein [Chloroflexi bacterium]|nr:PAS domain S-box protein [Chloroflexota bacterium]
MDGITKKSSISARLTLMVTGILVMAVLIAGSLDLFQQQRQLNRALETKATSLVQFMAQVSPLSILSLNFVEMNNNVKKVVLTDDEAVYVIILNDQGIPLVYFFKDTDPLVTNQVNDLVQTKKPLVAIEALKQTGGILEVTAPILSGDKRIGSATLGFSYDQMRQAVLIQIISIGIFLVAIISLSIGLLRLALRQILHPVQTLTAAAMQISKGDLNVVLTNTDRTDELGILARAFESMADQLRRLIAGLERNVAELKRTSQALQDSEERFRTAFENANVGVCLVATDGRLLKVNDAMCQIFGYNHQELEQMTISSIAYPDDLKVSPEFIEKAIAGQTNQASFDKRYIHKQGHIIWGHVSSALVRNAQGEPMYFISHVQDVTTQKQASQALHDSERRLAVAQRMAHIGYWERDFDVRQVTLSDEACRIFGISQQGLTLNLDEWHPRWVALIHPQDQPRLIQLLADVSAGKRSYDVEYRIVRPDGAVRFIYSQAEVKRDASGRPHIMLGMMQDITERKHAEEEIHKLNQELEQRVADRTAQLEAANKELEAFAYSVSHDLRAPLRHIDGFLELLRQRTATPLDTQSQHYMTNISDAARRMGILIDDLLAFSRMGRYEMSKMQVDLASLVQEVLQEIAPEIKDRNIKWHVADLPPVTGDRAMLHVVLVNLISNALKFTRSRQPAEIEIGCLPSQDAEIIIYVRDNGVGFDPQYADKLFGVFQRLHRIDEFEGTGIGLANVRRIIHRHGGRTWAESQVDQGATFYFSLPSIKQEISIE